MLGFFGVGLLLAFAMRMLLSYQFHAVFERWATLVRQYYADQVEWEHVMEKDLEKGPASNAISAVATGSVCSFVIALSIAYLNIVGA